MRAPVWVLAGLLIVGCGDDRDSDPSADLGFSRPDPGTVRLAVPLPRAMTASDALPLTSDLLLGGQFGEFDYPLDLSVLADGRILVLDGGLKEVFLFERSGELVRSFGREGEGPAEFKYPYALAAFGGSFVVLSLGPDKVFSVFDTLAGFQRSSPPPVPGDWDRVIFRSPMARDGRQQVPMAEELPARLSEFGHGQFLHSLRVDELTFLEDSTAQGRFVPHENLVVYGSDLLPVDSLASLQGRPSEMNDKYNWPTGPWKQLIWSPQSIWVGRNGSYAIHQPGSGEMAVFDGGRKRTFQLEWEPEVIPLSDQHRVHVTDWIWFRDSTATLPKKQHTLPDEAEKADIAQRLARTLSYSKVLPEVSWLGMTGACLLVSPFGTDSNIYGASLTLLVLDFQAGEPLGWVKLGPRGGRLRTAGDGGVWVSYHDEGAAMVLQRFSLPFPACRDPSQT